IGECDKALEIYDSAIGLEKQPREQADLYRKKAGAYERKADYENCEKEIEKGLALLGDEITLEAIQLLIVQAGVTMRTGGHDKAIKFSLKALAHAKNWGDDRVIGNALHILGSIYLVKGDFGNAINIMKETIEARELANDNTGLAGSLNNLGVSYYYSGKVNEALECFEDCFEAYSKVGDKYGMAAALNNLGGFTQDLGELEKALDYHKQSIKIKRAIGDNYGVASSLTNMGIVHRRLGDYEKALELHAEGLALAKEISNAKETIININNQGEVYLEIGELDKALEKYEEGIEASKGAGDVHQESHALRGISKVHIEKENGQDAIDYAKKSLDIAMETKNTGEEWRSRYILGSAYRVRGEFDKAQEELNKSTLILQETGSGESDPTIMFEEALLYRDMGKKEEAKQKFLDSREGYESKGYAMLAKKIDRELEKLQA
ncbi:MAG: tetratricopeptide repeat protein, partial [Thermoplasmata archaeon]|nr:tetratricopeptide repeat protein [Thermoplasmata archaeon]